MLNKNSVAGRSFWLHPSHLWNCLGIFSQLLFASWIWRGTVLLLKLISVFIPSTVHLDPKTISHIPNGVNWGLGIRKNREGKGEAGRSEVWGVRTEVRQGRCHAKACPLRSGLVLTSRWIPSALHPSSLTLLDCLRPQRSYVNHSINIYSLQNSAPPRILWPQESLLGLATGPKHGAIVLKPHSRNEAEASLITSGKLSERMLCAPAL